MANSVVIVLIVSLVLCLSISSSSMEVAEIHHRIIGGVDANIEELSYQVSVQKFGKHVCGGAIINATTILTAHHCFDDVSSYRYVTVRAGSNYTFKGGVLISACGVVLHKMYNVDTMQHDIALVKLCKPMPFSKTIHPIEMPKKELRLVPGTMATISGWGYEEEDGTAADVLKKAEVPIVPLRVCRKRYNSVVDITEYNICAGFTQGGKDACQGDSGGPLVVNKTVIGVISWGIGCGLKYPGVYTNVARHVDWILNNSNDLPSTDVSSPPQSWWDKILSWFRSGAIPIKLNQWLVALCLVVFLIEKFGKSQFS